MKGLKRQEFLGIAGAGRHPGGRRRGGGCRGGCHGEAAEGRRLRGRTGQVQTYASGREDGRFIQTAAFVHNNHASAQAEAGFHAGHDP